MAEFSILKLQLDDASFTANSPFSGSDEADEEAEGGRSVLPLVVGLVFLVVLAVVVKKLRGGGSSDAETE
jgi:hypothetical protein